MLNRFGPQKKGSLRNPDICTVLNSDPAYLHSYSIRKSSDYCLSRLDGALTEKIKLLRERAGTPQHYLESYQRIFSNMEEIVTAVSFKKKIIPISAVAEKSKPVQSLTQGVFASYESWQEPDQNWVYSTGTHMEFILDLGMVTEVNLINMDFLNPQAQPDWHLFALPKFLGFFLLVDFLDV